MGINVNTLKAFDCVVRSESLEGKKLLTLGRQNITFSKQQFIQYFGVNNNFRGVQIDQIVKGEFADEFFKQIGFATVDSMDYSSFEGAAIVHNLNEPISELYHNMYDIVLDGGTLEHVFNFPVAVESCMKLVKEGGVFISITPSNNLFGHGFYQFSPELYYRLFSEENGYRVINMFVNGKQAGKWYSVLDPKDVKERVTLTNNFPTELIVIAKKIKSDASLVQVPLQSDYQNLWENANSGEANVSFNALKRSYKFFVPKKVRDYIWLWRNTKANVDLGVYKKDHFHLMD